MMMLRSNALLVGISLSLIVAWSNTPSLGDSPLSYIPSDSAGKYLPAQTGLPPGVDKDTLLRELGDGPFDLFHTEFGFGRPPLLLAVLRSGSGPSLYVDLNGDQQFAEEEQVSSEGNEWVFEIDASVESDRDPQTLRVRDDRGHVGLAQGGVLTANPVLNGARIEARVIDANVNGRFSDVEDRLQLDLDGDGRFSPLRERFVSQGVVKINGERFTIGYGEREHSIELAPLQGTGYVIPKIHLADDAAEIVEFQAELVSTGGVHVSLNRLNSASEVPVGSYRVQRLVVRFDAARKWKMGFERSSRREGTPVKIDKGETVELDLLGSLSLDSSVVFGSLTSRTAVMIQPKLSTSTGMYLSYGLVGELEPQDDNRLTATLIDVREGSRRNVLAIQGTGFSCGGFCPISFGEQQRLGPSSLIVMQFDSGPLAGKLIRTSGPTRPQDPNAQDTQERSVNDNLELP